MSSNDEAVQSGLSVPDKEPVRASGKLRDKLKSQSPSERLQTILMEISDEADSIRDAKGSGVLDDTTVASQRRVVALKEMANLVVQLSKLGTDITLDHPILKIVLQFLLDVTEKVMRDQGLPQAQVDVMFSALIKEVADWETEIKARYMAFQRSQLASSVLEEPK